MTCLRHLKIKVNIKTRKINLISLCIDDDKSLEIYETIQAEIEDFKSIELDSLTVYDNRYKKQNKDKC